MWFVFQLTFSHDIFYNWMSFNPVYENAFTQNIYQQYQKLSKLAKLYIFVFKWGHAVSSQQARVPHLIGQIVMLLPDWSQFHKERKRFSFLTQFFKERCRTYFLLFPLFHEMLNNFQGFGIFLYYIKIRQSKFLPLKIKQNPTNHIFLIYKGMNNSVCLNQFPASVISIASRPFG